jgi:hypothetical protein
MNQEATQQEQQLHEAYQDAQDGAEILTVAIEIAIPVKEGGHTVLSAMEACKGIIESCKTLGVTKADLKLGRRWLPMA